LWQTGAELPAVKLPSAADGRNASTYCGHVWQKGWWSQPVNAPTVIDDGQVVETVRDYGFTTEQQDQLWEQWRQRESLRTIARDLGTTNQKVRKFLLQSGGIRLPASKRSDRHLSSADREEISRGIAAGYSTAVIAAGLGRAASTVSREVRRNGGRAYYRAVAADQRATVLAKRPKPQRLDVNLMLLIVVAFKLGQDWSPEQISQWLRRAYPEDASMRLSHEAIYRSIYIAERKALARCLGRPSHHLRWGRTMRVPRAVRLSKGHQSQRRPDRADPELSPITARATVISDLGSGAGAGRASGAHNRARSAGLLLRQAQSLAAGHERKHQQAPTAVSAKER
jgi:hypothetical protein